MAVILLPFEFMVEELGTNYALFLEIILINSNKYALHAGIELTNLIA
jgi:hypothetical protein